MAKIREVRREIMFTIGQFMKANMPSLSQVIIGWPENNKTAEMPSMTIRTTVPGFQPDMNPYEWKTNPINGARYQVLYVYGEYNSTLQLDIWARNKEERYRLLSEFKNAMLKQWPDLGLLLDMPDYYGIKCRYDFEDSNFDDDSEVSSQTGEWRVKIDLLAHCKAIHSKEEFAILQTELSDEFINNSVIID